MDGKDKQRIETLIRFEPHIPRGAGACLVLAALAALKATIKDLDRMDTYLNRSVEAASIADFEHWDSLLHSAVAKASGNSLLNSLFQMVNNASQTNSLKVQVKGNRYNLRTSFHLLKPIINNKPSLTILAQKPLLRARLARANADCIIYVKWCKIHSD